MRYSCVVASLAALNTAAATPWLQSNPWTAGAEAYKKAIEAEKPRTTTNAVPPSAPGGSISGMQYTSVDPVKEAITTAAEHAKRSPDPTGLAFFPPILTSSTVRPYGFIQFIYTSPTSARVEVRLGNFPEGKGAFSYHIHTDRVPETITDPVEQCKLAKGHLDPAAIGDTKPCDPEKKSSCQVGDLSGKQGVIPANIKTSQVYKEVYDEPYISWKVEDANYFVNRSIVIHEATSKARIACANIMAL